MLFSLLYRTKTGRIDRCRGCITRDGRREELRALREGRVAIVGVETLLDV
jgi:hypothetical protein